MNKILHYAVTITKVEQEYTYEDDGVWQDPGMIEVPGRHHTSTIFHQLLSDVDISAIAKVVYSKCKTKD